MALRYSVAAQNAACSAVVALCDAGSTNAAGAINFYTGTQPATPASAPTGTLLATTPLDNPSFGSPSGGTSSIITSPSLVATVSTSGTPGWARFVDRNGNTVMDVAVTATGGGGEITFGNTAWVSGGQETITSFSLTQPM